MFEFDAAEASKAGAAYVAEYTAYNAAVAKNQDNLKDWFTYIGATYTPLPARPCKPQVPDSAWNMIAYFGATTIDNFSADLKAKKNALLQGDLSIAHTLRTGLLQASPDETAIEAHVGHVFGKMGQGL